VRPDRTLFLRRGPIVAVIVTVAMAAGACGGDEEAAPTTTTRPSPTTTAPPPPPPAPGTNPLTGLPLDPARPARPALVVKIDNAPKARPQAGINEADVVVEEGVEGGVTRFAAIFHSVDAASVGPVRSARSTDIAVATVLGQPLFAYSGANAVFAGLLRASSLIDVGVGRIPAAYRREGGRPAPYNLFSSTAPLFAAAPGGLPAPAPLFGYRATGEAPPAGSEPAPKVQAQWRGRIITTVVYEWDPAVSGFVRTEDGTLHVDAAGRRVAPVNVIFQHVRYRDTGLVDTSGAAVPEAELLGEGEAWVLTGGRMIRGKWSKPAPEVPTSYTDAAGTPVRLTPGTTWVELVPVGNATVL
jgi:hypothetical protein